MSQSYQPDTATSDGEAIVPTQGNPEPPKVDWALPTNARGFKARRTGHCCLCGSSITLGDVIWANVVGGYACGPCKSAASPTWGGVLRKALNRVREKRHLALTREDLIAIQEALDQLGTLTAERKGDQGDWSLHRGQSVYGQDLMAAAQADEPARTYGLVLDALEYRFSPNFRTDMFLRLARFIEDPKSTDGYWTELFSRRRMRPMVTDLDLPDPELGWESPYDEVLDTLMIQRGWHSRASDQPDDLYFDVWTYGPVVRIRNLPFPRLMGLESSLTRIQCMGDGTYELQLSNGPEQIFASRPCLLRVLHVIEQRSWVPTDHDLYRTSSAPATEARYGLYEYVPDGA